MAKRPVLLVGVIFLLLGLLGFVSNPLIGENALFASDTVHNLIHVIIGVILLAVAYWSSENYLLWLKIVGVALFLLGAIGLATVPSLGGTLLGIFHTNGEYNWFHVIAGAVVFIAGVYGK